MLVGTLWVALGCSEYGFEESPPPPSPTPSAGSTGPEGGGGQLPPVADAGPDLERAPLDLVQLDATRSYDPRGQDIVEISWTLVERPAGSGAEVSDPSRAKPTLFLDLAGTYRLTLDVRNRAGLWDPTPDELTIEAEPKDALYVQLSWDAGNDLDLHLLDGSAELFGPGDCNYCNMNPRWGEPGRGDDPRLDIDAIFGFGPEAIAIEEPADGSYRILVHYYGEEGLELCEGPCASSEASVLVYVDGALAGKFARTLGEQGELWDVGIVEWPSGWVGEVDQLGSTHQTFCHP